MKYCIIFLAIGLGPTPLGADEINAAMLDNLPAAQVFLLGEVHDNPLHHENQARAVAAIRPRALVFEMLTAEQARAAYPRSPQDADALAETLMWTGTGWPDFALYYPIFDAAPEATIYGAAVPRDTARRALSIGAAETFGPDTDVFGLAEPLPVAQQIDRETMQQQAHCNALPADMLPGMVDIQRLRDATLAQAALRALAETGGPVVVITGTGHARTDWGVPAILRRAAPDLAVLSLGQFEGEAPAGAPFDLWLITDPIERPDPCAAFSAN
jgi:uncharacterized iron-regulated protein